MKKYYLIPFLVLSQLTISLNSHAQDKLKDKCIQEYESLSNDSKYKKLRMKRHQKFHARCDYKVFNTKPLTHLENTAYEYIGNEGMKEALMTQKQMGLGSLEKFRTWAESNNWIEFSSLNHFDWWMFPIGDESSQGYRYTVLPKNIESLKSDPEYLENYKEGLRLMFLSWGWDLEKSKKVANPGPHQHWRHYDVRLRKAMHSMYLFSQDEYFESAKKFLNSLKNEQLISPRSSIYKMLNTIKK